METNVNSTRVSPEYFGFEYGDKTYYFTISRRLNEDDKMKRIYLGQFCSGGDAAHKNDSLPVGLEFDTPYCLKEALVCLPLVRESYPQHRQFWDFFPFEGENLREVKALNNDALHMADMLINGTLDPISSEQSYIFRCAVVEPIYKPFNIKDFPTVREKLDCMLQIISGLHQLMNEKTLRKYKVVAHRDLKFNNVVVEEMPDGERRLRLIDFPSIKFKPREGELAENYTRLGFFSSSNTAPEDVMNKYSVSAKTDVFALGTMLAEIFEIWNYDGICNPLSLLFNAANNVMTADAAECRDFYNGLERRYPFENTNTANWLELALDRHDKNAAWDKIMRICPEIRTLFRAATSINPQHRPTLLNFEKGLKQIYKSLPDENLSTEIEEDETKNEPVTYILVDSSNISAYREFYIEALKQIAESSKDTRFGVLSYGSRHAVSPLSPDPSPLYIVPADVYGAVRYIEQIGNTHRGAGDASELKGSLYNLCSYLGNETNARDFTGEIHILAPELPNEQNTCCFCVNKSTVAGSTELCTLSSEEILALFKCKPVKVYVHTFDDNTLAAQNWYTPIFIKGDKPYSEEDKEESKPTSKKKAVIKRGNAIKGAGFHLLGGQPPEHE